MGIQISSKFITSLSIRLHTLNSQAPARNTSLKTAGNGMYQRSSRTTYRYSQGHAQGVYKLTAFGGDMGPLCLGSRAAEGICGEMHNLFFSPY
jgi:hypothetical protein